MADPVFAPLWTAFRRKDCDRVVMGVAAAFACIAAANGRVDGAETQRFLDVLRGSRLAPADSATRDELERAFADLTQALLADPAAGNAECLRVLGDFGFDPMRSEIVWSAARSALVADAQVDPAERRVAEEIRLALRVGS
jgi:tellurite resistance protein